MGTVLFYCSRLSANTFSNIDFGPTQRFFFKMHVNVCCGLAVIHLLIALTMLAQAKHFTHICHNFSLFFYPNQESIIIRENNIINKILTLINQA